MVAITTTIVRPSVAETPNRRLRRKRPRKRAPRRPRAVPARHSRRPCPRRPRTSCVRTRPERHADADLARALRDGIRRQAIDADRRKGKGQAAERRQHQHVEAVGRNRAAQDVGHPREIGGRLRWIDGQDRLPHCRHEIRRFTIRAQDPPQRNLVEDQPRDRLGRLRDRHIRRQRRREPQSPLARVADDADDRARSQVSRVGEISTADDERLTEGLAVRECGAGQRLIDDDHREPRPRNRCRSALSRSGVESRIAAK